MKHAMATKTKYLYKTITVSIIFFQIIFAFVSPTPANADLFDIGSLSGSSGSFNPGSFGADAFGAGTFGSGSANSIIDDIEKRYHLNPLSIQNLGEGMNISPNKEMAPQMNLFFNPTDPKNGQEITAQAFPLYFSSQKENLYFTWYLKRKECDLKTSNLSALEKKLCDLDNNNKITIEDWKIEAMRRVTNGGFAGDQVNYGQPGGDNDEYRAQFGGDRSTSGYCYIHDFETGVDYELEHYNTNGDWIGSGCEHLFPDAPGHTTGDGAFGNSEEEFWHTDPKDPSTAQNGNKDEANVVGLGQDKFTWNYASKDQVGVVIEGLSMNATKYQDSSMQVTWAFAKNQCTPRPTGRYMSGAPYNGGTAQIPTADQDLNDCIADNLVDPTNGNQAGKFEIQLTATPENPVIDSFSQNNPDNRGDLLTTHAVLINSATKDSNISYEWKVYANSSKSQTDDTAWEDITKGLIDAHAISSVSGSDLPSLKINLNVKEGTKANGQDFFDRYFEDAIGYFRINVTATENYDSNQKRVGRSSVVVKIVQSQAQIQTHSVDVDANWKLKFASASASDTGLLCEDTVEDRAVCPVVKGQIIGLDFDADVLGFPANSGSDISWLINNKPFKCSLSVSNSNACDPNKPEFGTVNYFPVTGDVGESYTIAMTATNPLSGKSLTLNRVFRVVDPSVLIISSDTGNVWPKYLGQYVDANGATTDNYSKDMFESFSGGSFALKGLFYPNSLKSGANVAWSVNGSSVMADASGLIQVSDTAAVPGMVYSVSLSGVYVPPAKNKKALFDIWGVSIADVVDVKLSRSVQVEMIQNTGQLASGPLDSSKKFFASIISYVPASVIFFFRLVVTMGLILLALGITFSFIPEKKVQ
ncbi:MAG: hypothetical protein PHT88_02910 [Candidatus Moranbacteria bacterium]|nr:hypothetical protein [Candidatus Moranbacteria bacterium]